jgi:hypothetical protein
MRSLAVPVLAVAVGLAGCAAQDDAGESGLPELSESVVLGPADGRDLPGVDLDRVQVGDLAPDFSLVSLAGPVVTLSDFRGDRNVVLLFYRGYW